jgi:hypothetical protein
MRELFITQIGGDPTVPADLAVLTLSPSRASVTASPDGADSGTLPLLTRATALAPPRPRSLPPRASVPDRSATSVRCPAWDCAPPDDSYIPDDLYGPEDPIDIGGPLIVSEQDQWDAELDELLGRSRLSAVDVLEWELWDGVDQDDAEREMLRRDAPPWVLLPPGGELASALEQTRPQAMSAVALVELMRAATRLSGWAESIKATAMASFYRQRRAEHAASPRPVQIDTRGRPIDPERSWYAEVALALGLSKDTVARRVDTALRLTGPLSATHSALRCGALTWGKAVAISEATGVLRDEAARAVEAHVLKRAAAQTHANLLRSLRTQVAKHTTRESAGNHRAAAAERTCKIVPLADGMAGLWIVHTADKIQQIWVTIQAMAALAKRHTPTTPDTTPADRAHPGPAPTGLTPPHHPATHTPDPETPTTPHPLPGPTGPGSTMPGPRVPGPRVPGPRVPGPTGLESAVRGPRGLESAVRGPVGPESVGEDDRTPSAAAVADSAGGGVKDARTVEQRRADVAADLFEHILRNGLDWLGRRLPDQHRRRPHIEVVVPMSTLLGVDDDPAELTGYGPIPAEMARRIAADGTWRRLLTDPINGMVLEASTTRHDPGTLVTETLLARHPVCAWPGCNHTSRDCDRDHTTPFARTGTTTLTGLAPYCEYHHVIKDTPAWGWTTTSHPDGSITLTTPTGHRYTTVPPARGPITQQADIGPKTERPLPAPGSGSGPAVEQLLNGVRRESSGGQKAPDPPPF